MMRSRALAAAALMAISTAAAAQWVEMTGVFNCGPLQDIVRVLSRDRWQEFPLWVGQSGDTNSSFVLLVNADKGNWTVLQYHKETACILGAGSHSNIVNLAPFREKQ